MNALRAAAAVALAAVSLAPLAAQKVYTAGNGVTVPIVIREVKPYYTAEAKARHIEGNVLLEGVVRPDGRVSDISVTRSLDGVSGLDQEAVKAFSQWLFKPGQKGGKDVAVSVHVEMTFTVK